MNAEDAPFAVAVAQFAPTDDTPANLREISRLAVDAASRGAMLVVFPEYSSYFTPAMGPDWVEAAQTLHGPFVRGLAEIAEELGIHLVAGLLEIVPGEPERAANTVVALDPAGEVVAHYRKQHLYDAFGQRESDWVEPGELDIPETFELDGMRLGLMTCYDLRFPELGRVLADAGAEVFIVPAEWVRGPLKEHHWRTLIHARAIENTVFVAAADHPPPLGVGLSMIVDPQGVELAAVGTATDIAVAHLDREAVARVRRVNPSLRLRRFTVAPRD